MSEHWENLRKKVKQLQLQRFYCTGPKLKRKLDHSFAEIMNELHLAQTSKSLKNPNNGCSKKFPDFNLWFESQSWDELRLRFGLRLQIRARA